MLREKSFFLLCLVLLTQLFGILVLRKRFTLINRRDPRILTGEDWLAVQSVKDDEAFQKLVAL